MASSSLDCMSFDHSGGGSPLRSVAGASSPRYMPLSVIQVAKVSFEKAPPAKKQRTLRSQTAPCLLPASSIPFEPPQVSAARSLSVVLSRSMLTHTTEVAPDQETKMREFYETTLPLPNWKEVFNVVAEELIRDQFGATLRLGETPSTFVVAGLGRVWNFEYHPKKQAMRSFVIGRRPGADMKMSSLCVSRVHLLVFPVFERQQILVADIASMHGFQVLSRSSSNPELVVSSPGARRLGIFEWGETAVLKIGDCKIAFNPKDCVVCFEQPRSVTFPCGHHVACQECVSRAIAQQNLPGEHRLLCFVCRKIVQVTGQHDYSSQSFVQSQPSGSSQ